MHFSCMSWDISPECRIGFRRCYYYRSNSQSVTSNFSTSSIIARVDSFIRLAYIIDCEIKSSPENGFADKRYYMLSMVLYYIADLPLNKRKLKMKKLRQNSFFRIKYQRHILLPVLREVAKGCGREIFQSHHCTCSNKCRLSATSCNEKIIMMRHHTRN